MKEENIKENDYQGKMIIGAPKIQNIFVALSN